MSLSDAKIRSIKPSGKPFKLTDSHGLSLLVNPGGSRLWYLKYRFNRKESRIALGAYPQVSLSDARQQRDGIRKLLAQNINQFAHKPFIVFVTAWKEHAVEAFELEAFDYILKPYQESRIISMLHKLEAAWQQQALPASSSPVARENDTINLVKDERIIVTPVDDIYYAEAHEKMTFVYTRRESYVMGMNITEFCNKLPAAHFFRCHRSFCVNLNKIREIEPWFNNTYILRLKDLDFQVPVSRSRVKEFRQLMHL